MSNITGTQIILYFAGIVLILFLLGLVGNNFLSFDTSDNPYIVENLEIPSVASSGEVSGGSSALYGWGYTPIVKTDTIQPKSKSRTCPGCNNIYVDDPDLSLKDCRYADITKNVDIDKYVLKSSIPPCPDLTEYAKKNQVPPYPFNKTDWVLKSAIPPCPSLPNMSKYILKSAVPACFKQDCPKCPECPICPRVPEPTIKVVYKDKPQEVSTFPQAWGSWTPKLSDTSTGFISNDVPMAPNMCIQRGLDTMPTKF